MKCSFMYLISACPTATMVTTLCLLYRVVAVIVCVAFSVLKYLIIFLILITYVYLM